MSERIESIANCLNDLFQEHIDGKLRTIIVFTANPDGGFTTRWASDKGPNFLEFLGLMEQCKFDFIRYKEKLDEGRD